MKKSISNKFKYYLIGVIIIFVVWGILSLLFDESNLVFPNMFLVFKETINLLKTNYTYKCLVSTFIRLLIGFCVAFVLALLIGTIAGLDEKFKYTIRPIITVVKSIPTASLVFLFIVLSGAKSAPIYIVILICFPILFESVCAGYENLDPAIINSLNLEKGNNIYKIVKIKLPLAIPYIIVGIASSLGLSFKIVIMAEVLTGSTMPGLGSAISYIQRNDPTNMVGIFAYSLIAVLISLVIDLISDRIC